MASSLTPSQKPDITLSLTLSTSPTTPRQLLKPHERSMRLIQLLLKCATHASSGNLHRANACLLEISDLTSVSGDPMQRLSARFASALAIRLVKRWPGLYKALNNFEKPKSNLDRALPLFVKAFPYLSFSYTMACRVLIQATANEPVIHLVDLGSGDLELWVPLVRGLANLPRGPLRLKLTCVHGDLVVLQKLGLRLVKEAQALDLTFEFNPLNISLRELRKEMLNVRAGETLAFISILNLHTLLAEDDRVDAHFDASKSNGIKDCKQMGDFLSMVRSLSPKLVFLVEREAHHNLNRLVDRFVEGLHYYSALFDSVDVSLGGVGSEERLVLEEMFGGEIENIVASEGLERVERHERCEKWMVRFSQAGFRPVRMWGDSDEDSKQMVGAFGKGYKISSVSTSLMICWHESIVIGTGPDRRSDRVRPDSFPFPVRFE